MYSNISPVHLNVHVRNIKCVWPSTPLYMESLDTAATDRYSKISLFSIGTIGTPITAGRSISHLHFTSNHFAEYLLHYLHHCSRNYNYSYIIPTAMIYYISLHVSRMLATVFWRHIRWYYLQLHLWATSTWHKSNGLYDSTDPLHCNIQLDRTTCTPHQLNHPINCTGIGSTTEVSLKFIWKIRIGANFDNFIFEIFKKNVLFFFQIGSFIFEFLKL